MIAVPPDGEKTIILATNANDAWTPADGDEAAAAVADTPPESVLVADLEIAPFVVRRAAEVARRRGLPVILDPSPTDRLADDLYPLADYLTPDATEAEQLTGIAVDSVEGAARAGEILVRRGVGVALMKLGGGGCVVVTSAGHMHIPDLPTEVVDATGAGDAFAGALAVAVLEGRPPPEAARVAVVAAHIVVGRYGSQPAYPTRNEVEGLLARWPPPQ